MYALDNLLINLAATAKRAVMLALDTTINRVFTALSYTISGVKCG
jgi:hypothetical protein